MGDNNELRFDGRVVLVTGAGNGLGKAYALEFAKRGAKVVVNDLGVDKAGTGKSSESANQVVAEIKANGGEAVANCDSVEEGDKLIQTALEAFGRIDVVVNNAGILRDKSFARIGDNDWDIIQRVHLNGAFKTTRAAWPHMRKQGYGRIIMTSSGAGIYGNFGQANYSAAKLGLLGLSNTLAIEGASKNIHCNTIAPMAGSRLTESVMPPDLLNALKPELLVPLVLYLCHESCPENGIVCEAGAGWFAQLRWQRSVGAVLSKEGKLSPEAVRDNWGAIANFNDVNYPKTLNETVEMMYKALQDAEEIKPTETKADDGRTLTQTDAIGFKFPETYYSYGDREVMLYALGVGVSTKQPDHLKFLFELAEDFSVLPTFGVIPACNATTAIVNEKIPGLEVNPAMILHGEQYMELMKPIPTSGKLTNRGHIVDVLDKGKGAAIIINVDTFDEGGEQVVFNQFTIFLQMAGGFGGKRSSDKVKPTANTPTRKPDASYTEVTTVDQAVIYRLSGDPNPLHIDPSFAKMGGFKAPILHGLCSFGYSVRHVLKVFCDNDVTKFKSVKVRFSAPVLPGQSLQTDMWKEGSRIHFTCKVVETGKICLTGAYVDLLGDVAMPVAPAVSQGGEDRPSDMIFGQVAERVNGNAAFVKKVKAMFVFKIKESDNSISTWTVDLKNPPGEVYKSLPKSGKADCTLTLKEDTFVDLSTGKTTGQQAFFKGKVKIAGNIMLGQKLGQLFVDQAKL